MAHQHTGMWLSLFITAIAVVSSHKEVMPVFYSVESSTSDTTEGAVIMLEYSARAKPLVVWFVNGVPLNEGSKGYMSMNIFDDSTKHGRTVMSSPHDKKSIFGLCLHGMEAENCMFLAPLAANGVVREELVFPWPDMNPGPEVTYEAGQKTVVHCPELDTTHMYFYSVMLFTIDPDDSEEQLTTLVTSDMAGGAEGDPVTLGPSGQGTGWDMTVRTDLKTYQGMLQMNTTFIPRAVQRNSETCDSAQDGDCDGKEHGGMYGGRDSSMVLICFLIEPYALILEGKEHPFPDGYIASIPNPVLWNCIPHVECMVACAFMTNGDVDITVTRLTSASGEDVSPSQSEPQKGLVRKLGPYMGYGCVFIPDFEYERDAGTYKCSYKTAVASEERLVEVS